MTAVALERPAGTQEKPPTTGKTQPRLFTRPLRRLTPKTSKGFEVIEFAASLGITLLPWQEWFLKHALELLPSGEFRFRTLLLVVARQNGKTMVGEVLTLWLMVTQPGTMVLGTSVAQELAREPWQTVADYAEDLGLVARLTRGSIDTSLWLHNRSRYKVGTTGRRGGRSLSVDLLLVDELREHLDWDGWNALTATTTARPNPITLALSNAGDDRSVVLNDLRARALAGGDDRLGIFEWSALEGCELDDVRALAQANPALGPTITLATLESKRGTMPPAGYRTEHLCIRVEVLDPAISKDGWEACADPAPMAGALRSRVVCGIDVSPDLTHVSLVAAAALDDGRVRVETVAAWESTEAARRELRDWLGRVKPRAVAWFPSGPAAALAVDLGAIKNQSAYSNADIPAICQGFSEFVDARRILHSADPLLTAQVLGTSKSPTGDGWRFTRKGAGNCDAVYAAAGAVHLARERHSRRSRARLLMPST